MYTHKHVHIGECVPIKKINRKHDIFDSKHSCTYMYMYIPGSTTLARSGSHTLLLRKVNVCICV